MPTTNADARCSRLKEQAPKLHEQGWTTCICVNISACCVLNYFDTDTRLAGFRITLNTRVFDTRISIVTDGSV
jgi:hypothetical protein